MGLPFLAVDPAKSCRRFDRAATSLTRPPHCSANCLCFRTLVAVCCLEGCVWLGLKVNTILAASSCNCHLQLPPWLPHSTVSLSCMAWTVLSGHWCVSGRSLAARGATRPTGRHAPGYDGRRDASRHGRRNASRHDGRWNAAGHDGRWNATGYDGRWNASGYDGRWHAAGYDAAGHELSPRAKAALLCSPGLKRRRRWNTRCGTCWAAAVAVAAAVALERRIQARANCFEP